MFVQIVFSKIPVKGPGLLANHLIQISRQQIYILILAMRRNLHVQLLYSISHALVNSLRPICITIPMRCCYNKMPRLLYEAKIKLPQLRNIGIAQHLHISVCTEAIIGKCFGHFPRPLGPLKHPSTKILLVLPRGR